MISPTWHFAKRKRRSGELLSIMIYLKAKR